MNTRQYVEQKVFKQTRTTGDVNEYEVVDRLNPVSGSRIVASFDTEEEAIAYRDQVRDQRYAELMRGR